MENRRQHYRHYYPEKERMIAHLVRSPANTRVEGVVVDLSVAGMCFLSSEPIMDLRSVATSWSVELPLSDEGPLVVPVALVHQRNSYLPAYGFRFLRSATFGPREEQRIWVHLLEAQRRQRRRWVGIEQPAVG